MKHYFILYWHTENVGNISLTCMIGILRETKSQILLSEVIPHLVTTMIKLL